MPHVPRVLVVEDDPSMRLIITKVLTSKGMMVRSANDGLDALNAFARRRDEPDLICADIMMPKMDGREFAKSLRQHGVDIPIMFISAAIQPSQEGYREKSHIYLLAKPFGAARLAEVAKEMLDRPRPQVGPRPPAGPEGQPPEAAPDPGVKPKGYDAEDFDLRDGDR
jgi:CheY-like chemotaxis protein